MTQPNPATAQCMISTIVGFLLPFFLAGADGNADVAKATIRDLIDGYNASTPEQLDLVGRIIGFSIVGMDNLRLSMTTGLSDTKVLQYRNNAVNLCRASANARKMLDALHSGRDVKRAVPRPKIAASRAAPKPAPPAAITRQPPGGEPGFPIGMDALKREARTMLAAFSRGDAPVFAMPPAQSTAAMVKAAVRTAVGAATRPPVA